MFFMGYGKNACLLLTFLIYLFSSTVMVSALDTITPSLRIQEPETISSNNSMFTLGFFSPQNSTNCYVGIWFMSESYVVWVANRNNPLTDSSRILGISENGNLVVLNGQKQVVWSTNVSNAPNSSAQLLDSGNLVLVDRTTRAFLWQSFEHPSNILLQDMKLSTNRKTGMKVQLTSWKSTSDPSHGRFSCGLEARNVPEVIVWKGNRPYWRSGPSDGTDFLGIPGMEKTIFLIGFRMKGEEGSFDLSFDFTDKLVTLGLDSQGILEPRIWYSQTNIWEHKRLRPFSDCDVYGKCGLFGICNLLNSPICCCFSGFEPKNKEEWERHNWTNGCVRREALLCERDNNSSQASKADGFLKLERVKLPDHVEVLPSDYEDTVDCQTPCLKNCSCIAYAHDRNLGCLFWNADLLDMQLFSVGGIDVYIRLAYSELGIGGRKMAKPIIISVLIGTILITASGYFLWRNGQSGKMQIHDKGRITDLKQVKIQELSFFDLKKLATAINNFDLANKLGQGGFGPVYKGKLEDGQEIAVKRLSRSSGQGIKEFINEMEFISKLKH